MEYIEYFVTTFIIIGIIGIIVTVIKYPRDSANGVLAVLLLPFKAIWARVRSILFPFEILFLIIENGVKHLIKLNDRKIASNKKEKIKGKKH